MNYELINANDCKPGERWLVRDRQWTGHPYEATIVEWSPSKEHVKVRYNSGNTQWLEDKPFIVEKLSPITDELTVSGHHA